MANNAAQVPEQYYKIYTLDIVPGIKRDGTKFESQEFTDGVWCRFQRKRPKKIGGYRTLFTTNTKIPRGLLATPQNGVNYIFLGNSQGIEVFTTGTSLGSGSGPFFAQILTGYSGISIVSNTSNNFVVAGDLVDVYPNGTKIVFQQSTTPVFYTVTGATFASGPNQTTVTFSPPLPSPATLTTVYLADITFQPNDAYLWQFDVQYSPSGGALNLVASPGANLLNVDSGIPTQVLVGNVEQNASNTWVFTGLSDSAGQNPTYRPITVDGGVCVLYPYIFVYGSNGFIANNHVDQNYADQSLFDWNGATANQVNMAASKVIKGVTTRGGTNAPSGLFFATDSLIRVSFTAQAPYYWRYDIISSQISVMSSSAIVEMEGSYFWMGVDRFYVYNGQVQVLPNDKNVNWLFNNLNYEQRQKVWATKIPRYNEIWFFYPRGTATECTDAIIYNVKDKIWYDAGSADGAQRSCGWTTEIFTTPIWADWNYNVKFSQPYQRILPATEPPPGPNQFYLSGNQTTAFPPGSYITFTVDINASDYITYQISSSIFTFDPTGPGHTTITCSNIFFPAPEPTGPVYISSGGYNLWQHEFGLNKVTQEGELAIYSSVTTADISWVGGTPAGDSVESVNRRMHLRRIEPDFLQSGEMQMNIIGRKFANGATETSGPYIFGPDTGKIDLRVEYRLINLEFISNTINGNYEMGRNLITAEFGDERP